MATSTTTLIGVFDNAQTAQQVRKDLESAGFPAQVTAAGPIMRDVARGGAGIAAFFRSLFSPDEAGEADRYSQAVGSGRVAVTATANAGQVDDAMGIMSRHRPVDLDERAGPGPIRVINSPAEEKAGEPLRAGRIPAEHPASEREFMSGHPAANRDDDLTASYDDAFRRDFEQNYARSGNWSEYQPAYQYGCRMSEDPLYRGKGWAAVEPQLKAGYLRDYPDSKWEDVQGAVRYGWETGSSRRRAGPSAGPSPEAIGYTGAGAGEDTSRR